MSKLSPGRYSAASSWSTRLGKTGKGSSSVVDPRNREMVALDGLQVSFVPCKVPLQEMIEQGAIKVDGVPLSMGVFIAIPASAVGSPHEHIAPLRHKDPNAADESPEASVLKRHQDISRWTNSGLVWEWRVEQPSTSEFRGSIVGIGRSLASEALTQQLIDQTDMKSLDGRREALRAAAVKAILQNSEWVTATQLSDIINPALKNKHAKASSFLKEKRVFALLKEGEYIYPRYQFDATGQPIPVVEQVLKVFDGYSSFRIAAWFESTSSALNGKRPREVLEQMGNEVLASAVEHTRGPMHG